MKTFPYLSVVVCIYNGKRTLGAAIDSLLVQDYPKNKYEIIFVDDGSTDGSGKICKELLKKMKDEPLRATYAFQKNRGLSSARNIGVSLSRGELIVFIDQDATADKKWLSEIIKAFTDEQIGVVGGKIKTLNNENRFATFIHWIHYWKENSIGNEFIPIIGANMAFRKEVFDKVGGFFEQFKSRGDENSFINLKVLSYFGKNDAPYAIVYHEHPGVLKEWFRERFYNGYEYAGIWYVSHKYNKSNIKYGYAAFRVLCFAFPFLLFMGIFFNLNNITIMGFISLACFLYRSFMSDNIFIKAKVLKREYGFFKSIFLWPIAVSIIGIGKMNDDFGFLTGLLKYPKTQIKDRICTDNKIECLLTNDYNKRDKRYS
jgi:glycosyltransferase involved in cell wall biosynthesis